MTDAVVLCGYKA